MACPHFDLKIVERAQRSKSVVASVAYQSGENCFANFRRKPNAIPNVLNKFDIQRSCSRPMLRKSTVLSAAVDDGYITRNPLKSNRLVIGGKEINHHKAIPHDKFVKAKSILPVMTGREKVMAALLCYTGLRFEEVLGLKWADFRNKAIYISRAVTHPTRNQPIIKKPKTKTSCRILPQQREMMELLKGHVSSGFVLSKNNDGKEPLSYTEARTVFSKVQKELDLEEYTAHDFRDTCATEWREAGIPIDVISRLLGHSNSEITEMIYIKYRDDSVLHTLICDIL